MFTLLNLVYLRVSAFICGSKLFLRPLLLRLDARFAREPGVTRHFRFDIVREFFRRSAGDELDPLVDALITHDQAELLKSAH